MRPITVRAPTSMPSVAASRESSALLTHSAMTVATATVNRP